MQAPGPGDALLVVDVQNDFLPGGALGTTGDDPIVAPIGRMLAAWRQRGLRVFLWRDWHPEAHCSFAAQGGRWPAHCAAGTRGAAFAAPLSMAPGDPVIAKVTRVGKDADSALDGTPLAETLRASTS